MPSRRAANKKSKSAPSAPPLVAFLLKDAPCIEHNKDILLAKHCPVHHSSKSPPWPWCLDLDKQGHKGTHIASMAWLPKAPVQLLWTTSLRLLPPLFSQDGSQSRASLMSRLYPVEAIRPCPWPPGRRQTLWDLFQQPPTRLAFIYGLEVEPKYASCGLGDTNAATAPSSETHNDDGATGANK